MSSGSKASVGASSFVFESTFVPRLLSYVSAQGGDASPLLARFSLPPDAATRAKIEVSYETLRSLGLAVEELLGDPFIGLKIAASPQSRLQGVLSAVAANAPTVGEALERVERYFHILSPSSELRLKRSPRTATLEYTVSVDPRGAGRHNCEFVMAKILFGVRELCRRPIDAERVWFQYAAPPSREPLVECFGTSNLAFGCPNTGISFDARLLDRSVIAANPLIYAVVDKLAQTQLDKLAPGGELVTRVRADVILLLGEGEPTGRPDEGLQLRRVRPRKQAGHGDARRHPRQPRRGAVRLRVATPIAERFVPAKHVVSAVRRRTTSAFMRGFAPQDGVAGGGLVAIGTSVALGFIAKGDYDSAVDGCTQVGNAYHCPPGKKASDATSAQTLGTVATIVDGIGGVAVVAGAVLFFTAPKSTPKTPEKSGQLQLVPLLDPTRAGLLVSGTPRSSGRERCAERQTHRERTSGRGIRQR